MNNWIFPCVDVILKSIFLSTSSTFKTEILKINSFIEGFIFLLADEPEKIRYINFKNIFNS